MDIYVFHSLKSTYHLMKKRIDMRNKKTQDLLFLKVFMMNTRIVHKYKN